MGSEEAKAGEFHELDAPYALDRSGYTASGRLVLSYTCCDFDMAKLNEQLPL